MPKIFQIKKKQDVPGLTLIGLLCALVLGVFIYQQFQPVTHFTFSGEPVYGSYADYTEVYIRCEAYGVVIYPNGNQGKNCAPGGLIRLYEKEFTVKAIALVLSPDGQTMAHGPDDQPQGSNRIEALIRVPAHQSASLYLWHDDHDGTPDVVMNIPASNYEVVFMSNDYHRFEFGLPNQPAEHVRDIVVFEGGEVDLLPHQIAYCPVACALVQIDSWTPVIIGENPDFQIRLSYHLFVDELNPALTRVHGSNEGSFVSDNLCAAMARGQAWANELGVKFRPEIWVTNPGNLGVDIPDIGGSVESYRESLTAYMAGQPEVFNNAYPEMNPRLSLEEISARLPECQ